MPLDTIAIGRSTKPRSTAVLLRRFLQAYWLRPENALWMTLRSETLAPFTWNEPAMDIACGDGVFMFLHGGGEFDPDFDVFQSAGNLDAVSHSHADMFDHVSEEYGPAIVAPPEAKIDVGADMKPSMLAKARTLALFGRLVEHDNNEALPFSDASFSTIYCNSAYWIANIEGFLSELRRVTKPDGRIILQVKLESLKRYTFEAHRDVLGRRWLDIIGRGRVECWPSLANQQTWERRFEKAGLSIFQATPFITRTHAYLWDIGLRPVAPLLVRMADALSPATRSAIKRDWVNLFEALLLPLCQADVDLFSGEDDPGEIQYILIPTSS